MRKIRKTGLSKRQPDRLAGIGSLTRRQAVTRIRKALATHSNYTAARELVELFDVTAEELTEAGVPFESVKALENRCLSMRFRP